MTNVIKTGKREVKLEYAQFNKSFTHHRTIGISNNSKMQNACIALVKWYGCIVSVFIYKTKKQVSEMSKNNLDNLLNRELKSKNYQKIYYRSAKLEIKDI